jgi:hypothetical protein
LSGLFLRTFRANQHVVWLALLATALSVGWFFLDGNVGLNLADEGQLWLGTQAVRLGQVPIRDFQAYDPGRYLWTAAWSYCLGEGIYSVRLACVLFQCLGVLAGLLAARRLSRNWLFLICIALLLCAWMHPRYKVFEQSIALMSVYAGVLLLERPSVRRHWWLGIFGGLAAFVGRNHGAYHVFAFGLLILWAARGTGWRMWLRRSLAWGAGLLVGYVPQWLMFIFVPRYFHEFVQQTQDMLSAGTNLPRPVPWPWLISADYPFWVRLSGMVEGCWYILLPAFLVLVAIRAWQLGRARMSSYPVLAAAAVVIVPYGHYVFSRPDIVHLTHGAPILGLGLIALAFSFEGARASLRYLIALVLMGASFLANLFQFGLTAEMSAEPKTLFAVEIKGHRMLVRPLYAQVLVSAHHLAHYLARADEPILFLPLMPGLYPFTDRLSPVWRNYFVYPLANEDRAFLAEIEKAKVEWVMLQDYALDGRDDLRFRNANPLVFEYFRKNFSQVPLATLPDGIVLLRRSRPSPGR